MNVERLKMFVHLLLNLKTEVPKLDTFDLSYWYRDSTTYDLSVLSGSVPLKEGFCNTGACALGSAALYKPFNKMGLRVDYHDVIYKDPITKEIYGESGENAEAGAAFFGISMGQADWLFYGENYRASNETFLDEWKYEVYVEPPLEKVTPAMVAARVQAIIDGTDDVSDMTFGIDA